MKKINKIRRKKRSKTKTIHNKESERVDGVLDVDMTEGIFN
jgi:hypothetical protein